MRPSNLPPPSFPFVNIETGEIQTDWFNAILNMWTRMGATVGLDVTAISLMAQDAFSLATSVQSTASQALLRANEANTGVASVQSLAASAENKALLANVIASTLANLAVIKAQNLSDIDAAIARRNLGVEVMPLTFRFDTVPAGMVVSIPIVRALTIPANLVGSVTWAQVVPLADALFTLQYIRSGVVNPIGSVVLIHGGNFSNLSGTQTSLVPGDILQCVAPSVLDSAMSWAAITIRSVLS